MNILFVAGMDIVPNRGGVQRVTDILGNYFLSKGHQVTYLSTCKGEKYISLDGISHYFLPNPKVIISDENKKYLKQILNVNNIELIINQCGPIPEIAKLVINCRLLDVKIITVVHGSPTAFIKAYDRVIEQNYSNKYLHAILKLAIIKWFIVLRHKRKYCSFYKNLLQNTNLLVLLSKNHFEEFKVYYPKYPKEKVISIANPVSFNPENVSFESKEKNILFVGRLDNEVKRCDLLLFIWKDMSKQFLDWKLIFVGDGYSRKKLEEYVALHKIERVYFEGYQDPKDYYRKASIFCMTSIHEGFPMVLPEAMSYGVVPVAFNSFAALSDVVENDINGLIVDEENTEAYRKALILLMTNEAYRSSLANKGLEVIELFSIEKIGEKWLKVINSIY